jgi:hypothetical protein
MEPKLCVFTTYLTHQIDPQRGFNYPKNYETIFYPLMIGCIQNNITLFIFHDNVGAGIINNITRFNKNIKFIQVELNNSNMSNNDYRFKIYLDNLHLVNKEFTHILFSDAGDVFISKNPLEYMKQNEDKLIICDEKNTPIKYFNQHYNRQLLAIHHSTEFDIGSYLRMNTLPLNAGMWGGNIIFIRNILKLYVKSLEKISSKYPHINCNNILLNVLCKSKKYITDSSIFSPFKQYLLSSPDYFIFHK